MRNLILLLVLSLFSFSNAANAYALIEAAPPVEKVAKSKKYKKRLFKKKSKRVKGQAEMKKSTLFSVLSIIFSVGALILLLIGFLSVWTSFGIVFFAMFAMLSILFLILAFIFEKKEKETKTTEE
jgi:heme/copper-type cytochrome/quinol oxidase subunit 4